MGMITTHVLDTSSGRPGSGISVSLYRTGATGAQRLATAVTNADGRVEEPLLAGEALEAGVHELVFAIGDYFRAQGVSTERAFLDEVVIRFSVSHPDEHYHVPLLIAPGGYTTYRGS